MTTLRGAKSSKPEAVHARVHAGPVSWTLPSTAVGVAPAKSEAHSNAKTTARAAAPPRTAAFAAAASSG